MASSVFYKFKSRKDESRVTFDGTGISVFDLKKEIILANNLGKANDFDLRIYSTADEEYTDDTHIIPRSTGVVVKRLPSAKPGRGSASFYLASNAPVTDANAASSGASAGAPPAWQKMAMSKRFDGKDEFSVPAPPKSDAPPGSGVAQDDEAAAIAAMFQAQDASWGETQEKMSHATYIHRGRGGRPATAGPNHQQHQQQQQQRHSDRPLPPSYVCYRCGQKGHWIQDCPTNNDREYDNRPRMKRTTGIPRSFLKTVENPGANATQGVMITPEGGFVVAQPDIASWQKQLSRRAKALTEAEVREREPSDASLACPIDSKLFRDAVKTPCCAKTYCEDCIQSHLLERDFVCPNCSHKVPGLDKLRPDVAAQAKVAAYIDKTIEESKDHEETADVLVTTNLASGTDVPAAASSGNVAEPADALDPASMPQIIADSVPQLQAQVQQLALMLQNPALPKTVRAQTEVQHQQLQMQLQQAQAIAHALAASHAQAPMASASGMPGMGAGGMDGFAGMGHLGAGFGPNGGWNPQFGAAGSVAGEESAYQRLPVNNRRRNLKRERPSDLVEIAGADGNAKQARYWE